MDNLIHNLIHNIQQILLDIAQTIGFLNIFFCLTLMLVGTLAKMVFDKLDNIDGRTNKVINWVTIIIGLIYWYHGGILHELVFTALAFQRAFELIFHWIEKLYVGLFLLFYDWLTPVTKPVVEPITNKIKKWFNPRLYNK